MREIATEALIRQNFESELIEKALEILNMVPEVNSDKLPFEQFVNAILAFNKASLMAALNTGVPVQCEVEYAGSGDSGGVEDVSIPDHLKDVSVTFLNFHSPWIRDGRDITVYVNALPIKDFLWYLFDHYDYENNEGGQGTVTFTSPNKEHPQGVIVLEHSDNVIETVDYEHAF
ncbi:DUF6878 family protein [Acidihalobacter ferrooxydans]|uniref:DUF6878 domain-containing protein n=1 Tax=Acidihalobacter ferrooxydans TaxID=1765967 RepID=A0A1P8UF82_9GAMM|nr:DUF6878 family protein [Acidihalobacter ferrooxydans]APZ42522.1 hypothetical protein BW247_04965 [Acidihalobacter ferrooxydans]